jgi:hypothetical protein
MIRLTYLPHRKKKDSERGKRGNVTAGIRREGEVTESDDSKKVWVSSNVYPL